MQPNCLKGRVVCGTVYGEMHLKDLLGSFIRVGYRNAVPGFLSSATWPSLPEKHYNGLNQIILSLIVTLVYIMKLETDLIIFLENIF